MKKIRWGIIGCGDVTERKSGPAFQLARKSELIAVMRRNGELAKDYAERHRVPKWCDKAESLIYDPDVDAVYIATPPSSHREYTISVARAGKPVYVEKPMAMNYAECQEMIAACEQEKVPLFMAYYRRALPRFLKIKSLIDDGMIGDVRTVSIRFYEQPRIEDRQGNHNWRVNPKIAGCGYFCDLASHMIDFLQYALGDIKTANGLSANQGRLYPAEDTVGGIFMFDNGIMGNGVWCFNSSENLDYTEIVGTKGKIVYSTFDESPIKLIIGEKITEFEISNPKHIQQPLIQLIVDELLGYGKCPSTGKTGSKTNWVMDKILGRL